jgi:hypothetical protein
MADDVKPIRRVVTGNDTQGRSCVLFDSAAPNVNPGAISRGTCMTNIWVYESTPAIISGAHDDGNLPFHFEPPAAGGHLRIVQSNGKPADYDPAKDPAFKPLGPTRLRPDGVWDRGGQNFFSSPVHKVGDGRLRNPAGGRAHAHPRPRQRGDESWRRGGAARQLARMEQHQRRQPHGLRHDGCSLRQRTEGLGNGHEQWDEAGAPHRYHRRRGRKIARHGGRTVAGCLRQNTPADSRPAYARAAPLCHGKPLWCRHCFASQIAAAEAGNCAPSGSVIEGPH